MHMACNPTPVGELVLVIMPVFGHAALVQEAIVSVRESVTPGLRVKTIISVDGDPQQETFHQLVCATLGADDVHVLFGANGGPGAARNRAIDFALRHYPDAAASYFLDADNRLLGPTLAKLHAHLKQTGAGWVYMNIDTFSVEWRGDYGSRYSRLAHCITDNICDTGSLVSQDVFRAGIRFHEDRVNGFEDWDFWLSCIKAGFVGSPCQEAGFEYRLRAESRFKDVNRSRHVSMDFLRKQHRALFRRDTLVGFEHEESPRFALIVPGQDQIRVFSDPTLPPQRIPLAMAIAQFWSSQSEPDNNHFPPYVLACDEGVLNLLQHSRMLPNILCQAERLVETHHVVFVHASNSKGQRKVVVRENIAGHVRSGAADLAVIPTTLLRDAIRNNGLEWLGSIAQHQVWPTAATIDVSWPFRRTQRGGSLVPAEQSLMNFVHLLAASSLREKAATRWTWRPKKLPAFAELPEALRRFVDGRPVMPLGPRPNGQRTAAVLVPIASFGGAEKVAFALARELKASGYETHLFVLGANQMAVLDEFDQHFDFVHFWAKDIPIWGSTAHILGHDFVDGGNDVDWAALKGLLAGFDLVVNNHVMVAHSLMSQLRSGGSRTVCYLHVVDETTARRPAGQVFAAAAFEHAYDAYITCSKQLKLYLHSFGVPLGKVFAALNGAGFSVSADDLAKVRAARAIPIADRPLRILYLGRLDLQKGIDRLLAVFQELTARGLSFSARVVGGELIADSAESWTDRLSAFATVLPPAFASRDLFAHLAWADVLLLPSRWEGAPLVVAEAQMAGCIPIAADVGAVAEMIIHGEDGLAFPAVEDSSLCQAMADAIMDLARQPNRMRTLAEGGLQTAAGRSWRSAFEPFLAWCETDEMAS